MSIVTHKYTPAEIPEDELEATFAARGRSLDYLLKSLRDQIRSGTLSSFVITGPRGAGKSTLINMVALRIRQDPELRSAWLPVVFPEEQFNFLSLRDLLSATLQLLAKEDIPSATEWREKVEAETNDEQSQQLAVTGLREICRQQGKRLVLFVENLNLLLEDSFDIKMKATLRRLLMTDPYMLLISSAVRIFTALKDYDEAFFNYFGEIRLDRLTAEEVFELLTLRARFDSNERFLKAFPGQQAKVRAITQLSGGNPRLILMLYELLSQRQVTTIIQYLRRLVDELTPLLKDEMENLPPQQRKIMHALMEKGGTAQPTDLASLTRLPLTTITAQLRRLKETQIVEVLGGGKGRAAFYTVPDKLFSIWYQMRYLSQNRRWIELFVDVLRIWFEEEERLEVLRKLAEQKLAGSATTLRESAATGEYFAASLKGTRHEQLAADLSVRLWVETGDFREAALSHAEFFRERTGMILGEAGAYSNLGQWLLDHDDPKHTIQVLDDAVAKGLPDRQEHANALHRRGVAKFRLGIIDDAIRDFTGVIEMKDVPNETVARALFTRGITKERRGDIQGGLADYSAVIANESAPKYLVALAFVSRGSIKEQLGDSDGAIADFSTVIDLDGAPKDQIAWAIINRGFIKGKQGDSQGALTNYTAVINMEHAPKDQVAMAFLIRGITRNEQGDSRGALDDFNAIIELDDAPADHIASAFVNRGVVKIQQGDIQGAVADFTSVIEMEAAPEVQLAMALENRGIAMGDSGDNQSALVDFTAVIEMGTAPKEVAARSFVNRGIAKGRIGDSQGKMSDYLAAIDLGVTTDGLMTLITQEAFKASWHRNDQTAARMVLERFATVLNKMTKEEAREISLSFLRTIAAPELKEGWPFAWKILAEGVQPEVAEAIRILEPVYSVLSGKDRSLLDALPPEQREFVQVVLSRFETTR